MFTDTSTHFFLGGNTPQGFYSLYDQLYDEPGILYILKGGPGCGKSSFMRKVAKRAVEAGHTVEYIHCSGDPASLDAILIPTLGLKLCDGTAPHVAEPRLPAVSEVYLDLGRHYDHGAIATQGEQVRLLNNAYKGKYRSAYRILAAAGNIYEELLERAETPQFLQKAEKRARGIISRELPRGGGRAGRAHQRFLNAVTCAGRVTLQNDTLSGCDRVFELRDGFGLSHRMLDQIATAALDRGLDTVLCRDPLAPDRLVQLIVPSLSLAFAATDSACTLMEKPLRRLWVQRMSEAIRSPRLRQLVSLMDTLLDLAVQELAEAKALHDELEAVYNPHVDFDAVYADADRLALRWLR